jgi:VWFA-related protein
MRLYSFSSLAIAAATLSILPAALSAQDGQPSLRDRTGASSAPQTPASDDKTSIHDKTKEAAAKDILLAVTVRDKKGNLVPNLTAADFALTEDGRSQTIKSFAQPSDAPQLVGLAIDTSAPVSGATSVVRTAAQKFVQSILPANASDAKPDQAFLMHFDNQVELLEDFTNSREKLMRELDTLGPTSRSRNNPRGPETREDPGGWGQDQRPTSSSGGTQLYDTIYLAANELMKPKQGRKALIVFSMGVDRSSKETQSEAIDAAERSDTVVYAVYFRGGEERQSGYTGMGRTGTYPGGGGGGYPGGGGGYPGGGGGYPGGGNPGQRGGEKAPIDGKKVMQDVASRTGGQFYEAKKSDQLPEIYNQISTELKGQYVLIYAPDKPDDEGGYHKILLTPKNSELTVKTRTGYYSGGDSR